MDRKMFKTGFLVGVFSIIAIGIYSYFNMKSITNEVMTLPIELAQLDLENTNSEKVNLKSTKPIIINFWATWCVPCVQEFPEFEEMNAKYGDKINFVMLSDEEMTKINKFKTKNGYKINILRSRKEFSHYGLKVRPATYFYNSKAELSNNIIGLITKEDLEKEILKLLEQ